MEDLFIIQVPKNVVNEGGYIADAGVYDELQSHLISAQSLDESSTSTTQYLDFQEILHQYLVNELGISPPPCWVPIVSCGDDDNVDQMTTSSSSSSFEVKFSVPRFKTEYIINSLGTLGIGDQVGKIWVTPLDASRPKCTLLTSSNSNNVNNTNDNVPDDDKTPDQQFIESLKSRMIVEKIVEIVRASATFSFDYVSLLVVASLIALFGLAFDNVVVIVASMLVSPIMGPVVAVTFGTIIRDKPLFRTGMNSETLSLTILVLVGYVVGLAIVPFSETLGLPTEEMKSRGDIRGLISGVLVAIPSGFGVALSILGDNTSSLVGVAISASLLPPAVNTGFFLAIASLARNYHPSTDTVRELVNSALTQALYSFSITILNIVVIYVTALLMFKFKEVAPIPGKNSFWKDDVKTTRNFNGETKYGDQLPDVPPEFRKEERNSSNSLKDYVSMKSSMFGGSSNNSQHTLTTTDLMALFKKPAESKLRYRSMASSSSSSCKSKVKTTSTEMTNVQSTDLEEYVISVTPNAKSNTAVTGSSMRDLFSL